jgi:prolycopene isomerase
MYNESDELFDVIVIGGGMGGLVAGNLLLKKGYKVLLIEKNSKTGGCCSNFMRKDFRFDTAIHFINGCSEGGMIHDILKLFNAEDCIEFIPLHEVLHWIDLENDIDIHVPVLLEEYVEKLVELFPEEEEGIRKFYNKYSKIVLWLLEYVKKEKFFPKMLHFFKKLPTSIRFLGTVYKPLNKIIDKYIKNESLKEIMTALCTGFGLFREEMSALNFLMGEMSYRFEGAFYPKGGGGLLAEKITEIFTKNGGTLLVNHKVTKINVENDRATSILVENNKGEISEFKARGLIVNSDATKFAKELCGDKVLPDKYLKKYDDRKTSYSSIICFLGLNCDLKQMGITEYELWRFRNSKKNREDINKIIENRDYKDLPIEMVTVYSNLDPTCCPEGKSVVSAIYYTTETPYLEYLNEDGSRKKGYKKEKERIKEQFIRWMSEALNIPDLDEYIEVADIITPLTLSKFTANRGGAHLGWKQTPKLLMKDPIDPDTPLKNVILAGQWTFPGGGVASVILSGYIAGEKISKILK